MVHGHEASLPWPIAAKQILSTVEELVALFGWSAAWTDAVVEHTWTKSRSGNHFALVTAPGHDSIILKFLSQTPTPNGGFHENWASATASAMEHLRTLLAERPLVAASSPQPLGWMDDPAVVASGFLRGTPFTEFLRDPRHEAWETSALIEGWVETAGAALAVWHAAPIGDAAQYEIARSGTASLRRLRLGPGHRRVLLEYLASKTETIVDLYRDYGPGNLLGAPGGQIVVLDPPAHRQAGPRQKDAADFLFGLDMNLSGRAITGERVTGTARRLVLRKAFLRGYRETSGIDLLEGRGGALLSSFEAAGSFGMVRKRVRASKAAHVSRRRRWMSAAWAARNGATHRISARRQINNDW